MATVFELIASGVYDEDLDEITESIRIRRDIIGLKTRSELKIGDTVRFSDRIRPKYMIGLTATVVKINYKSVIVDCPNESDYGRFAGSHRVRCPNDLIEGLA